jgi:secreted Zn-dependent insulinase-like peptidase
LWALEEVLPESSKELNSAILVHFQFDGPETPRLCVVNRLLNEILTERAFKKLRTEEQLGYVVF